MKLHPSMSILEFISDNDYRIDYIMGLILGMQIGLVG